MLGGFGSFDGFGIDPFGGADALRQEIADELFGPPPEQVVSVIITVMPDVRPAEPGA